jgi:hypothetical protein
VTEILYLEQASEERQIVEDWEGPVGWHLETVGKWLTDVYPWESVGDAIVFLVSGKPPRLAESLSVGINMGSATYSITFAPWVTEETVSRAYRETQHSRHRLPQYKTVQVLRFVSEQTDEGGRLPSWATLLDRWNRANPTQRFSDRSALRRAYLRAIEALVPPYLPMAY